MKQFRNILTVACALVVSTTMALVTPEYNTEKYYIIRFANSQLLLTAGQNGSNLTTQQGDPKNCTDKQLWKFSGTASNFQLVNKEGQFAAYSTTAQRILASDKQDDKGWTLNSKGTTWEMKWQGANDGKAFMNQWGGTGIGTTLGLWSSGDTNNQFVIIDPSDVETSYSDFHVTGTKSLNPDHPMTLWYDEPATVTGVQNIWMEYSLPIGNGELGGSLFGGIRKDEIQFNEKTLWMGGPNDLGNHGTYRNFGSLFVEDRSGVIGYEASSGATDYYRSLDIHNGVGHVHYTNADGSTTYDRTYIASHPDSIIAVRYKATGKDKLHLLISLTPGEQLFADGSTPPVAKYFINQDEQYGIFGQFSGKLTTVNFFARIRVVPVGENAEYSKSDAGIEVKNADEVVIYLTGRTNFDPDSPSRIHTDPDFNLSRNIINLLARLYQKGFDNIYADHLADFTSLTERVDLNLEAASTRTTKDLINYYNTLSDLNTPEARFLEQLYFNYGRYLEISSSRGMDIPNNLQGIWNNKAQAPWNSDIHTNINIQMNYWPAEPTNLSECHLPFLNYIIRNAQDHNWQRVAKQYAKVEHGWTVFTESNIFGGMSTWGSNYFVANAWYCSHLWQHFRYTRDETFLAKAFPVMWSCAQFWFDRMVEDKGYDSKKDNSGYRGTPYKFTPDGTFVAPNEYSAEQNAHASENGTAHAQQLIYDLLTSVKAATTILDSAVTGLSEADIQKLDLYIEKTDRGLHTEEYTASTSLNSGWTNPRNGIKKGDIILREWKYSPYDVSDDPGHRHMSHLMALYPLTQIDPSSEFFQPAVNSLNLRGDMATGWSMGWKVNLWARAQDGDHAHTILKNALKHSTDYGTNQYAGGVYYNLYDAHAPFQIDGNFGCCAGIAEMLLQSQTDTLQLLPALPSTWPNGHINGLKAVGNFEVNQTWEMGRLTTATIKSISGLPCPVKYPGIADRKVTDAQGNEVPYKVIDANTILIETTQRGATYTIDMSQPTRIKEVKKQLKNMGFTVVRNGDFVTVTGKEIRLVEAYDTTGCLLASTKPNNQGIATLKVQKKKVALIKATHKTGVGTKKIF